MTKYDPILKAEVINAYLQGECSYNDLAERYDLPVKEICKWVNRYRLSGTDSLIRRRGRRKFTAEFKLSVIDYYQTHDESTTEVAAKNELYDTRLERDILKKSMTLFGPSKDAKKHK